MAGGERHRGWRMRWVGHVSTARSGKRLRCRSHRTLVHSTRTAMESNAAMVYIEFPWLTCWNLISRASCPSLLHGFSDSPPYRVRRLSSSVSLASTRRMQIKVPAHGTTGGCWASGVESQAYLFIPERIGVEAFTRSYVHRVQNGLIYIYIYIYILKTHCAVHAWSEREELQLLLLLLLLRKTLRPLDVAYFVRS